MQGSWDVRSTGSEPHTQDILQKNMIEWKMTTHMVHRAAGIKEYVPETNRNLSDTQDGRVANGHRRKHTARYAWEIVGKADSVTLKVHETKSKS